MKKVSIFIFSLVVFTGLSLASTFQAKQNTKTNTEKKPVKKSDKKEVKKVPARKTISTKPATTKSAGKQ